MKVLIADDDRISRRRVEILLQRWGFEVDVARNGTEALQILRQVSPPRLAILDWMMPEMDGAQVCQEVRKAAGRPYTYLVLLTARDQAGDIVEGLESGADEYLCKPFNPAELRARIRAGCRILDLEERLTATSDAFRVQATHDALTGLWNRAAIIEILQSEIARSAREGSPFSVLIADVDHFKQVNDTHGHLAGDAVLREVAGRMKAQIRIYDSLGRYGGEEFLFVIPGSDSNFAQTLAERLRAAVCNGPMQATGGSLEVTISIGVAGNERSGEPESLIRAADEALYRAKEKGRNRVEVQAKHTVPI
jgi:diguanylate cyclase (GGDEF)-like protein